MRKNLSSTSLDDWERIPQAGGYAGEDRVVHFADFIAHQAANQSLKHFKSLFPVFDEKLGELMTSEVTVISGKTGEGKTLFAESWLRGLISKNMDTRACIFSYEVSPLLMLDKYATDLDTPIYLPLSLKTMDVNWLVDRCFEAKIKFGCEIFIFDHLHFLVDMQTKQNMSLNIGAFMRRLKTDIAVGMNVCPILIAHQKGVARGEEPSLEDVRDSTFIAQESDNVVIVWRRPDYKEAEINEIIQSNPVIGGEIRRRTETMYDPTNPFANRFAMVQIAKARRQGTYRWKKAFQKVGQFLEEI